MIAKRKKELIVALIIAVMLISGFFSALIYKNYFHTSIRLQSNDKNKTDKTVLGVQKEPTITGQVNSNNSQKENNNFLVKTVEAKPLGFCLNVPVIFYHHIEPIAQAKTGGHAQLTVDVNNFDGQMKYLKDHGYRSISAEELVNAIYSHQNVGKAVVVTVDDAYSDVYTHAFSIAKKYSIILNLMVPSGLLENPGYMNWGQLKEMVNSGLAKAYDHTWSHYSLPRGDEKKIEMEVMTAKKQLEQNLGTKVNILAYPYGSSDQKTVNILQRNAFIAAFSTIPSFYQCESYIFNLRRNRIGNAPLSSYGL